LGNVGENFEAQNIYFFFSALPQALSLLFSLVPRKIVA